jgi:dTDP-4-amino-4,6-dideoxygalactose transaminase
VANKPPIVPMLDLRAQHAEIGAKLETAVLEVVRSGQYILGPAVVALEEEVARYVGARHGIGVSSGTDALLVALMALGVGPGDRVITTAYSFFATAGAIARLGATPVFVDIDPGTYNVDPRALEAWLGANRDVRVRAMVVVHLFGQCADLDAIVQLARARDIAVVEDAAQALGASWPSGSVVGGGTGARARMAGAAGTIGCVSFFPSKNLGGLGDGGMVVTDDDAIAERTRKLRVHGAQPKYHHALVGGNFRLDTIQAAALRVKLPHLDRWNARRRAIAARYDEELAGVLATPRAVWGRAHHAYHQYVVRAAGREQRDAVQRALAAKGIETAVFYPVPLHLQACFAALGYRPGALPESERAAAETLALPIFPAMSEGQQELVVDAIRHAVRGA